MDEESALSIGLQQVLVHVFGQACQVWTEDVLRARWEEFAVLVDGTPALGLASWDLFAEHWDANSGGCFAPGFMSLVGVRDDEIRAEIVSFHLFDERVRSSTSLLAGSNAEPPTILPLAAENDGAILVVNPARCEDGPTLVVSVFHGEAWYFRTVSSDDDEREALGLNSQIVNGIDHVRDRGRLPLLSEFINVVISNYLEGRFYIDESGHCWAGSEGDGRPQHHYPWIPRSSVG